MTSVQNTTQSSLKTPLTKKRPENEQASKELKPTKWVQIRLIPIWLRLIIVGAIFAGALAMGLVIGYGYLGEGDPGDVLRLETWKHILDIIKGVE